MKIIYWLLTTYWGWGILVIAFFAISFAGASSPNIPKEIAKHNRQVEKEEKEWAEIEKIKQQRLAKEKAEAEKAEAEKRSES